MQFTVRQFMGFVLIVALVFTAGTLFWEHQLNREYKSYMMPIWQKQPYTSSEIFVGETNDIIFEIENDELLLTTAGDLIKLSAGMNPNYALDCPAGYFRIVFYKGEHLGKKRFPGKSRFEINRDAAMLHPGSPRQTKDLWWFRQFALSGGARSRLNHFDNMSKKGFIVGKFSDADSSRLILFDHTGNYEIVLRLDDRTGIGVQLRMPKIQSWDELADRVQLVAVHDE